MSSGPGTTPDVIVIGGGVIGLSIAWELAQNGVSVRVLEQGSFGQEASWAGAGMLIPGNPEFAKTIEAQIRAGSHVLWPVWTERLREQTGIDNGFVRCGGLEVIANSSRSLGSFQSDIANWRAEGVLVEELDQRELRKLVPAINPEISHGYHLPDLGQVRNPRHLKALYQACVSRGVDLRSGNPVFEFDREGETITGVRSADGEQRASEYIVAGGAWSRSILRRAGNDMKLEPVRGQIVLLDTGSQLFRQVIQVGARYLVPRRDGRVLIGSTEEHAGFEKQTTAEGVTGLLEFGQTLVPSLRNARFEKCWAGLRPCTPDGLPRIGRIQGYSNLSVAAGHFRAGLQLSPITAVLVRQLVMQQDQDAWVAKLKP